MADKLALRRLSYQDIKKPENIINAFNENKMKTELFVNDLSTYISSNPTPTPTTDSVYFESGTLAYNYNEPGTFTTVNGYTSVVVTVTPEYSLADFPSPLVPAFQLIQTEGVYTGVTVTPHSHNLPATATAYFHVHVEGRGKV